MSRHGYNIIFIALYWLPEKAEMLFWKNCKCSWGDSSWPSACSGLTCQVGLPLVSLVMSRHGYNIIFIASYWLPKKAEMLFWKDCKCSWGGSGLHLAWSVLTGQVGLLLAPLVMSRHGYNIIFLASYRLQEKADMWFWKDCKCSWCDSGLPLDCSGHPGRSDCSWHH